MKLLVIGSCTKNKDIRGCPYLLTEADFGDGETLRKREAELSRWIRPASKLYLGWQHRYMMEGVRIIRATFGEDACRVNIISAGYGLVEENQPLVPYEVTFQGKPPRWIAERAEWLGIPQSVRKCVFGIPLVVLLLGKEYLHSVWPPLIPSAGQRFLFLTQNPTLVGNSPQQIVIPAGRNEASRYHAGTVALKGKMFEYLAKGLCSNPSLWDELQKDTSSKTAMHLIEEGLNV